MLVDVVDVYAFGIVTVAKLPCPIIRYVHTVHFSDASRWPRSNEWPTPPFLKDEHP